jgi:predicted nicotinamide N-methyase
MARAASQLPASQLVETAVPVAGRTLRLLHPPDPTELIDEAAFEREEFLPYWAELWPSARALADAVAHLDLRGARVVELGCGLALPSVVGALGGAQMLATDWSEDALAFARRNARRNGAHVETLHCSWSAPEPLLARAPFDLVLASDVLYERRNVELLVPLLPALGETVLLADPGRPALRELLRAAEARWDVERDGLVYRLVARG